MIHYKPGMKLYRIENMKVEEVVIKSYTHFNNSQTDIAKIMNTTEGHVVVHTICGKEFMDFGGDTGHRLTKYDAIKYAINEKGNAISDIDKQVKNILRNQANIKQERVKLEDMLEGALIEYEEELLNDKL